MPHWLNNVKVEFSFFCNKIYLQLMLGHFAHFGHLAILVILVFFVIWSLGLYVRLFIHLFIPIHSVELNEVKETFWI